MNLSYLSWTLRKEWKGGLIYFAILIFWILIVIAAYPSFAESVSNPLSEVGEVKIEELENGTYNMTWNDLPGFTHHAVVGSEKIPPLEDYVNMLNQTRSNQSDMEFNVTQFIEDPSVAKNYMGMIGLDLISLQRSRHIFIDDPGDNKYFFVFYFNLEGGFHLSEYVDINNLTTESPWDTYLGDNSFVEGFVGNIAIVDLSTYEGFVVIEFLEMWTLLIGIYAAIKGVSFIVRPIDDHSMDILLATGYTREQFLAQKTITSILIIIFLHIGSYLFLALGAFMVNESFLWGDFALVFLTSLPFALSALAIGVFVSSFMSDYRSALWTVLGVILFQYMFQVIGNIMDSLDWFNYLTIFGYWKPTEMLFGSGVSLLDPMVLVGVTIALFIAAWLYFRKRDLPA